MGMVGATKCHMNLLAFLKSNFKTFVGDQYNGLKFKRLSFIFHFKDYYKPEKQLFLKTTCQKCHILLEWTPTAISLLQFHFNLSCTSRFSVYNIPFSRNPLIKQGQW